MPMAPHSAPLEVAGLGRARSPIDPARLPAIVSLKNGQKSVDMQNQFIITEGQRATFLSQ